MSRRARSRPTLPSPAEIDRLYGLEPVFEPGEVRGVNAFVRVECPYCGESYDTPIELAEGAFRYIEDCQICCQPIELCGAVEDGALTDVTPLRLD
jgi:hypothetical protein